MMHGIATALGFQQSGGVPKTLQPFFSKRRALLTVFIFFHVIHEHIGFSRTSSRH
jgi:hypothetical protein